MKSKGIRDQNLTGKLARLKDFRLSENLPVPVVLLFVLALGSLAGIGFFMKSLALENRLAKLESGNTVSVELQKLRMSNEWLRNRVSILQEEKAHLLDSAVADLNAKSRVIESILNSVGIDIPVQVSNENSGGPFTSSVVETSDALILRADRNLDVLQNVPLGGPVPGVITSRFGQRIDPINGKPAYHQGVDIRGRMGAETRATADGVVIIQSSDKGNGRYILLDHGNGFRTKYAHLKKSLVAKGDTVKRGQVIGLVGNTGRSTGPHVHYEIHYDDKIVNPTKFVRIAKYLSKAQKKK